MPRYETIEAVLTFSLWALATGLVGGGLLLAAMSCGEDRRPRP